MKLVPTLVQEAIMKWPKMEKEPTIDRQGRECLEYTCTSMGEALEDGSYVRIEAFWDEEMEKPRLRLTFTRRKEGSHG